MVPRQVSFPEWGIAISGPFPMVLHRDVVVTWNGRVSVNFRGSHDHPKLVPIPTIR